MQEHGACISPQANLGNKLKFRGQGLILKSLIHLVKCLNTQFRAIAPVGRLSQICLLSLAPVAMIPLHLITGDVLQLLGLLDPAEEQNSSSYTFESLDYHSYPRWFAFPECGPS